jgi:hypothetical protein
MNLPRRRLLVAFLTLPCLAPAQPAPSARALSRLQTAELQRDRLRTLVRQFRAIEDEARTQTQRVRGLTEALASAEAAQAESRHGVDQAVVAITPLRRTVGMRHEALTALLASAEQSRQAVAHVSAADVRQLADATRVADIAFAARRDCERSFALLGAELRAGARKARLIAEHARSDLDDLLSHADRLKHNASEMVDAQVSLLERYAAACDALRISLRLGDLADVSVPTPAPALPALDDLKTTLSAAGTTRPLLLDSAPLALLAPDDQALEDSAAEAQRLSDAKAYLELVGGPGHVLLAVEYRAFVAQETDMQTVLAAARERLLSDVASAEAVSMALVASLASVLTKLDALTSPVASAGEEARELARKMATTTAALRPSLEAAEGRATAKWRAAYRAAYGLDPLEQREVAAGGGLSTMGTAAPRPPALMKKLDLRGHAYDFFDTWNGEREGYGAYTYVLLRSANDLQQPDVRRRYEELLGVIQTQSDARDIRPEDTVTLSLFCIPVVAARERSHPDLKYGAALGCQIKVRTQSGMFTRPELRARLTESPGPFLLTLPQRIDAVGASSPLLFADLSSYPADAITDLATSYMGSLLQDFPTQQALWRPPVPQRVALSMIWFAREAGALIESTIPSAEARR